MSHIPFVEEMDHGMLELAFNWFTVLKESMYPVEVCVQPSDGQWVEYLAYDRAYLHVTLSSTQGYLDFAREARFGIKTIQHLNKSLRLLREKLAVTELAISDSTISTVLTLTMFSDILGYSDAAQQHLKGLYQLVSLRGGIQALRHNPELQFKVLRDNKAGAVLLFDNKEMSSSPLSSPPYVASDEHLRNVALDLREFCLAANLAYQTGRKIPADLYCETLVSVQYRLLALRDEKGGRALEGEEKEEKEEEGADTPSSHEIPAGPDAEALLRLGMLAFTSAIFLQIKRMPVRYGDLARRVRECADRLARVRPEEGTESGGLVLWFLSVARTSVLVGDEDEELLARAAGPAVDALQLWEARWPDVRELLRRYMWIDWVHSKEGAAFWERLSAARK
ncbi:hypothetical protein VTG60DRAFT_529 [Thermothelomyces hinnuleus]